MVTCASLVKAVLRVIETRLPDPFSLDGLSEPEADLLSAVTAIGVIGNGGLYYWYQGKDRDDTIRTAEAFERLRLGDAARAMRESLAAFPDGLPADLEARHDYLSRHRERLRATFESLEEVIWESGFAAAAAEYIDARRSDLAAAAPELARLLATH